MFKFRVDLLLNNVVQKFCICSQETYWYFSSLYMYERRLLYIILESSYWSLQYTVCSVCLICCNS